MAITGINVKLAALLPMLAARRRILRVFHAVKKYPEMRELFKVTIKSFATGKITKLSELNNVKEAKNILAKLPPAAKKAYEKNLVPIGFPKIITRKDISRHGRLFADPNILSGQEEKVLEILEDHIDFLKDESFFEKAHKEAKKFNIIDRSERARLFYHNYALNYSTGFNYTNMLKEGGTAKGVPKLGKMMFFRYRPTIITSRYDLYPLIFVLSKQPNYFEGINFHYMSPKERAVLLGNMFTYLSNQTFDITTRLIFKQFLNAIKSNKKFKLAKESIRRYNFDKVDSRIIEVHPLDWELAIMVETEKFFNDQGIKMPNKIVWKDTRINARSN